MMLEQYVMQGVRDAYAKFSVKVAILGAEGLGTAGAVPMPFEAPPTPFGQGRGAAPSPRQGPAPQGPGLMGGLLDKAKGFGQGQWGAAKDLAGNLRQGLGGAESAGGGAAARGAALGNLKTLAPTLLAGGGLYMLHRHHQAQEDARRQQMMPPQGMY